MLRNLFATFDSVRINHSKAWILDNTAYSHMLTFVLA